MRLALMLPFMLFVHIVSADTVATHIGNVDPTIQGWELSHFVGEDLVLGSHLGSIEVDSITNDGGINSWEIIDNSSVLENGGYSFSLSPDQEAAAVSQGFVMTALIRPLENTSPSGARVFVFGTSEASSDERWVMSVGADDNGDPMVAVQGGNTATLVGAGTGYHTFQLTHDPAISEFATVSINGVEVLSDQPSVPAEGNKPRFLYFGSWSNASVGGARYGFVEFEILPPVNSGDFDGNGRVDARDFLFWQRDPNVGLLADWEADYSALLPTSDFDSNGRTGAEDFLRWQGDPTIGQLSNWEAKYGAPLNAAIAAVPEPASCGLLVCAVCCMAARLREIKHSVVRMLLSN